MPLRKHFFLGAQVSHPESYDWGVATMLWGLTTEPWGEARPQVVQPLLP